LARCPSVSLPTQTSHSGKYLGTDGSAASWSVVESGMAYTEAAAAPAGPTNGDLWLDTDDEILYQYQTGTWVQVSDDGSIEGLGNLTTKGDLEVFSTTQGRLPVGTNDQVLTADSTASTGVAWATIVSPKLDSPSITGVTSLDSGASTTHTITNWSDDITYVITPTNCTTGAINTSGQFLVTHTSGVASYTSKATTDSLGLDDSSLVTKNLLIKLSAPTLSSPADEGTATNVVYTITSTDASDDKIILDIGSSNFTYQSVSTGSASKVGNTVECTGFSTGNPAVTIQFTAEATYSVKAKSTNIAGSFADSNYSATDSLTIQNIVYQASTGGTVTTSGNLKYHTFTSSGSFVIGTAGNNYDTQYFIIGGGGGGASGGGSCQNEGGGHAGSLTYVSTQMSTGSYSVTIGGGGAGIGAGTGYGGASSSFNGSSASGGGGGQYGALNGGDGIGANNSGGYGGAGTNAYSTWATATSTGEDNGYYGGGGGASGSSSLPGGAGGGGTGSWKLSCYALAAGTGGANTGSGGGASHCGCSSGPGGSGIVIIRYQYQA